MNSLAPDSFTPSVQPCNGIGIHDVWLDVCSPAGWLGNAVGGTLSDCPLWIRASAFYPSRGSNAVFGLAAGGQHPFIFLFSYRHPRLLVGTFFYRVSARC